MEFYLFALRSLTYAQRAKELLAAAGISARLLRTPAEVSPKGCSHSLRLKPEDARRAAVYLRGEGISIEKVFATTNSSDFVEVRL